MPEGPGGIYAYDPQRKAADGKWYVIVRKSAMVEYVGYQTEAEARRAVGLEGGSTDTRYIPE